MEQHIVKIIEIEKLSYNVKKFIVEKPLDFIFSPGQACDVAVNKPKLEKEFRPFTPIGLTCDEHLEFAIKEYKRGGFTEEIHKLKVGDELILGEVYGDIKYAGPGIFFAGGTGVNPFYAIFQDLSEKKELDGNILLFSNKTKDDIMLENELKVFRDFGLKILFMVTDKEAEGYFFGRIDYEFLKEFVKNLNQNFYICGPPQFDKDVKNALIKLGVKDEDVVM